MKIKEETVVNELIHIQRFQLFLNDVIGVKILNIIRIVLCQKSRRNVACGVFKIEPTQNAITVWQKRGLLNRVKH